jgi:hypothetical protein
VGWDYHVQGALVAEPTSWISASLAGAVQSFAGRAHLATVRREARVGLLSGEYSHCPATERVSRSSVGPGPGAIFHWVEDTPMRVSADVSQAVKTRPRGSFWG